MLENLAIINSIEDQRSVDFTGKINLLSIKGQHLGELIFIDGEFVLTTNYGLDTENSVQELEIFLSLQREAKKEFNIITF